MVNTGGCGERRGESMRKGKSFSGVEKRSKGNHDNASHEEFEKKKKKEEVLWVSTIHNLI